MKHLTIKIFKTLIPGVLMPAFLALSIQCCRAEDLIIDPDLPDLIFAQETCKSEPEELIISGTLPQLEQYFDEDESDWSDELVEDISDEEQAETGQDLFSSRAEDKDMLSETDEDDPLIMEEEKTEESGGSSENEELPDPAVTPVEIEYEYGRISEKHFASGSAGAGCSWVFGSQVSGGALSLYNARVSKYVQKWENGSLVLTFTKSTSPVTFDATDIMIYNEATGNYRFDTSTEVYQQAKSDFAYAMQASVDALLYDHPELYWYRAGNFTYAFNASYNTTTQKWTGFVSSLTNTPGVIFPGADSAETIAAYRTAVNTVASAVYAAADYNLDGSVTDAELLQSIHDYLCTRLYYDRNGLATYQQTKDYRIFSSIGAFLDSAGPGVVCEGYAKAFKVLCDHFGFDCILIGGETSSGEGHMWNGVQIGSVWYLMDVTWDDVQSAPPSYSYYLTCNQSGRTPSGNFGGSSGNVFIFSYPVLTQHTHTFTSQSAVIPAVSPADGTQTMLYEYRVCAADGISFYGNDHAFTVSVTPPTCTQPGYTTYTCARDNLSVNGNSVPALGHQCREDGVCVRCGISFSVKAATVTPIADKTCSAAAQTPPVILRWRGQVLKCGEDYTVVYSNNQEIGTASVLITGIGDFVGTRTVTFKILPPRLVTSALTCTASGKARLSWDEVPGASGYQVEYAYSAAFSGAKRITVSAGRSNTDIAGLTPGKCVYVRARVYKTTGGIQYCGEWSVIRKEYIKR